MRGAGLGCRGLRSVYRASDHWRTVAAWVLSELSDPRARISPTRSLALHRFRLRRPGAPVFAAEKEWGEIMIACTTPESSNFELRFNSLFDTSRALAFPCDALGRVDLDTLSLRARSNYLYARAMVGRDFALPHVDAARTRR